MVNVNDERAEKGRMVFIIGLFGACGVLLLGWYNPAWVGASDAIWATPAAIHTVKAMAARHLSIP
jgi:hypothetical protein